MSSLTSSKTVRHGPVSHGTGFDTAGSLGSGYVFSHFRLGCPPPARSIEKSTSMGAFFPAMIALKPGIKLEFPKMIPADLKRETFPPVSDHRNCQTSGPCFRMLLRSLLCCMFPSWIPVAIKRNVPFVSSIESSLC
jgi:hypothetical protein